MLGIGSGGWIVSRETMEGGSSTSSWIWEFFIGVGTEDRTCRYNWP